MSEWIDISVPIRTGIVQWPGDPAFAVWRVSEAPSVTAFSMCAHTGTHVDAPLHYLPDGKPVDTLALDVLIGPAVVVPLEEAHQVNGERRVLLCTRHSQGEWWREPFRKDFESITPPLAHMLVQAGVQLVGIDYLSVGADSAEGAETHRILLNAGIVLLEGLDLSRAEPGEYDLICLPLRLEGADGAPARAVMRKCD